VRLGEGISVSWFPDSSRIIVVRGVKHNDKVIAADIVCYHLNGTEQILFHESGVFAQDPAIHPAGNRLIFRLENQTSFLIEDIDSYGNISNRQRLAIPEPSRVLQIPELELLPPVPDRQRAITTIRGVPYHHQVYCTPSDFNGHWACNGTAATMALAYYGRLSNWNFVATSPYNHTSHFGNYVSEIYTYNGHTYNIASPDASGTPAYGAYGYIVQNNWEETRGHMREYISYHNVSSPYVDWSPTWAKISPEVDARYPFVMLTLITTSGHYKTVVGYYTNQHSVYFNDPYGNKNQGYMNFNGAGVSYDWP
ncbi:C39 family peptidase, partial [bacterium]|nr:C39 family peptidase [candidate division CSSED10-310 bacterium]